MQSASPELARSALDAAPDAMIMVDAAGIVRYANRQVAALFGYAHDEIVGQSVERLLPERLRTPHVAHRQSYASAMRVRPMGQGRELLGRRADGSEFPVEISLSPIGAGAQRLVAAAIRDVTERKRVEAELVIARETADAAREAADRANQSKSRFLATASHDLRQPLQTLALLNGTLRRMVSSADAAEALAHQEQAISAMAKLLNALLDVSKLESGAIKPEPGDFPVAGLFEELRREFAGLAASRGLSLEVEPCAQYAHSDPALVAQILRNLLANAIKYTPTGGVRLECQGGSESIRIDVRDTGIGIAPAQVPLIFDEFYQVGVPANRVREGYGLGLNIVQRLVRLLDVRLDVASELGKGSVFSLHLPAGQRRAAPARGEPQTPGVVPANAGPRILLVEDDASVRNATRLLLRVEGYRVTAVASLAAALRCAREEGPPDLLITDYHLSDGETGIQVLAALRDSCGAALKAVLITGDTSLVVRQLAADERLRVASKPVNAEELLALLRDLQAV